MRALVIGEGLIGTALVQRLRALGHAAIGTTRHPDRVSKDMVHLNLDIETTIPTGLSGIDIAYFCAAITDQEECRKDEELAHRVNALNPAMIARSLVNSGTRVVLLSTSAVLDCRVPRMAADRPRRPANAYGRTKAEAEVAFLELGPKATILRLTKILTLHEKDRLVKWTRALATGEEVKCANDFRISPISLDHVLGALVSIAAQEDGGIFQVSAASDISYAEAALQIVDRLGISRKRVHDHRSVDSSIPPEVVTDYTSLDTERLRSTSSFVAPDPRDVIDSVLGPEFEVTRKAMTIRAGT